MMVDILPKYLFLEHNKDNESIHLKVGVFDIFLSVIKCPGINYLGNFKPNGGKVYCRFSGMKLSILPRRLYLKRFQGSLRNIVSYMKK